MELSELKRWRIMVPALMLCCSTWPLTHSFLIWFTKSLGYPGDEDKVFSLALAAFAIPAAVVYDALDLRRHVHWQDRVREGVAKTLWSIIKTELTEVDTTVKPDTKLMMRLFYKQIDRDPTLKELASRVRSIGLAASSCADGYLILITVGVLTLLTSLFVEGIALRLWGTMMCAASATCIFLLPALAKRHAELSDQQLHHIELFGRQELSEDYTKMAPKV